MIITIDGPTASGKSSAARTLARELGFFYMSSGLLYRALAYALIELKAFDPCKPQEPTQEALEKAQALCTYTFSGNKEQVFIHDKDITNALREPLIDHASSVLSTYKKVRTVVDAWQHMLAHKGDVIIDGRDSGTVVFPKAHFKFFLTASDEVRAARWSAMQYEKFGKRYTLEQAKAIIKERDNRDSGRALAPLKVAEGGIVIDSSSLSLEETVVLIKSYLQH